MPKDESLYKDNILKLSILLSFVLHFLAIQLIHFNPIKPFQNKFSAIEVVLTNSKDNQQEDAEVLAQSNSNKGGNIEKDVHKKSPLPIITENKNTFQLNNRGDQPEVGKASSVAKAVSAIAGVTIAEGVTGPYDVIMRAEAASMEDLGRTVLAKVQGVAGITRTLTCPVTTF